MVKQAVVILMVVIAFGVLVPLYKGFGILDPRIIAAYGFLALLFVAPPSADLQPARGNIFGRIGLIVAWGWGITVLILATAIVTLNIATTRGSFLAPPPEFIASVLSFSLTGSIAIAMLGAVLARRLPAATVKSILRISFLIILLSLAFGSRVLPESVTLAVLDHFATRRALTRLAWEASAASAGIAALLLLVLLKSRNGPPFAKITVEENSTKGGR